MQRTLNVTLGLQWKRQWVLNNPEKARYANQRWRAANVAKVRSQARERMKRFRGSHKLLT